MSLIVTALAFLHVFSAIGYLGSALTFGLVIGPRLPKLSPTTSNEFFAKVGPAFVRFTEIFSWMTIIFGLVFLYAITGGNLSLVFPSSSWGLSMSAGMVSALAAFLIGIVWVTRSAKRLVKHAQALLLAPGQPPQEMLKLARTLKISSTIGLLLLIAAVVFMVVAASM
ncbi:MAG: hypothetical protein JRM79_05010 [Nitrososphaerota archaeon]|jgi:uncharacterized membrane protein|nr:hypothetical protein [Nitrososphaerota archaeon]MCL5672368.1 hypothetical protein [Nitrososphaerota archaeon]MDG6937185.1 hypothetical protein [Nitrososphaerota archaeon]MDG6958985.1 hypothetical protein [Nitrososphaerota archaeon]MDG6961800.1 hypothetical protein [Nitrososphaerota archaeon]